ncbi:hypothetical protein ACFRAE_00190 [Sphingobacterium sp. HJSM2_6]|uniref:hypothetical protein n=1 Tax=Sphingobacterium sp. HJSM2_6 TaxID=3366264 RepID=UPI003BD7347B
MPNPVGESIPSEEYPKLEDALASSPYTLYSAAWKRSNITHMLTMDFPLSKMLFLVPTNEAMEKAGLTAEAIATAKVSDLDSLILYHTLNGSIPQEQLMVAPTDILFNSLLTHPIFREGEKLGGVEIRSIPYRYQHYVRSSETTFSSNGITFQTSKWLPIDRGFLIPIDQVAQRPKQQMIDFLRNDPRFTLFIKSMEITSKIYEPLVHESWIFPQSPIYKYFLDFFASPGWGKTMNDVSKEYLHLIRMTLFAPTNEAFNEIGIYSENDLIALNNRSVYNHFNYDRGSLPVDSLIRKHFIINAINQFAVTDEYELASIISTINKDGSVGVFYSESLKNEILDEYSMGISTNLSQYLEYDFGNSSNGITVKHKHSTAPPATIIQENINTFQGPIHVVDKIILPNNFSMWHIKN